MDLRRLRPLAPALWIAPPAYMAWLMGAVIAIGTTMDTGSQQRLNAALLVTLGVRLVLRRGLRS